jgi:hypothetical protein
MAENYYSSNMFLHKGELEELTGYRMPARQIAWLKGQGIRHWTNATSRPVVPRSQFESKEVANDHTMGFDLGKVR